ncbi:YegP family protein [Candidatus Poribacteria bacterium]
MSDSIVAQWLKMDVYDAGLTWSLVMGWRRREVNRLSKFQVYKDRAGEYRWRLRANNNKIIADSGEGYVDKSECKRAVDRVKEQAPQAIVVELN